VDSGVVGIFKLLQDEGVWGVCSNLLGLGHGPLQAQDKTTISQLSKAWRL
jgi:hypothetical protein